MVSLATLGLATLLALRTFPFAAALRRGTGGLAGARTARNDFPSASAAGAFPAALAVAFAFAFPLAVTVAVAVVVAVADGAVDGGAGGFPVALPPAAPLVAVPVPFGATRGEPFGPALPAVVRR